MNRTMAMLFFALWCFGWVPARAAAVDALPDEMELADAAPLSAGEMGDIRGGFTDPTGLLYNFSVDVQTALNGAQVFTRSINIAPGIGGALVAQQSSAILANNVPHNLTVGLIGSGRELSVTDANGTSSQIFNQTAAGVPSSIVINSATIATSHRR